MGFFGNLSKQVSRGVSNLSFSDIGSRLERSITDPIGFTTQAMAENPVGALGTYTAFKGIEPPKQQAPRSGAGLTPEQMRSIQIDPSALQQTPQLATAQPRGQFGGQFGGQIGSNRLSGLQAQQANQFQVQPPNQFQSQRANQFQGFNEPISSLRTF